MFTDRRERQTVNNCSFFFSLSPQHRLGKKIVRSTTNFTQKIQRMTFEFFFTWSFKDTTRRKRLGPDMLDGDCRERSQHWWFDVQVWRWWGKPIQARLCYTNGRMKEMHTLYTFPKAPSPSSPMTAHTSSGFTSLRTCSYCFFFFSAPNLNIFRKLKNDIAKSIKLKKQCT